MNNYNNEYDDNYDEIAAENNENTFLAAAFEIEDKGTFVGAFPEVRNTENDVSDEELREIEREEEAEAEELESPEEYSTESAGADIDPVKQYMKEINQYPLLKPDEEISLAKKVQSGFLAQKLLGSSIEHDPLLDAAESTAVEAMDHSALEAIVKDGAAAQKLFVNSNLRLVVSIAKKYTGHGVGLLDLVQEGNLGLMTAVKKFDYRRGFRFSTYATHWIKEGIYRSLPKQGLSIALPYEKLNVINRLKRVQQQFFQEHGTEPTDEQLADRLDMSIDDVEDLIRLIQQTQTASIDKPVGDEEDSTLGDLIIDDSSPSPHDVAEAASLRDMLMKAIDTLDDSRERDVMILHYGLKNGHPKTLKEIRPRLNNISEESVRKIEIKALRELRNPEILQKIQKPNRKVG